MITLKVTGSTPLEALAQIAALASHCQGNPQVRQAAERILEAERRGEAKELRPKEKPEADTPFQPSASQKAAPASAAKTSVPSLEQIREKGIQAARKHGQPAVKEILQRLGADNMTALAEDKRGQFLAALEALAEGGGQNA